MIDSDLRDVVARSPWFDGLPDEAIERLAEASSQRELPAGDHIYRQGFPTTEIFCVLSGRVRVTLSSPNPQTHPTH